MTRGRPGPDRFHPGPRRGNHPEHPGWLCNQTRDAWRNVVGFTLIDNLEILRQADQLRALAHDIMRQAVQRAHAVVQMGQQAGFLDEGADALVKVIDG